ncbi:ABC transporter permease subunit [Bradyrhizobium yuanmingense]|uniref:ABC transporter permease n=1 Tax=Bradyrhizobium yuanmingense TaxID=108015 RepID=UPI0023B9FD05|nr:ABC transporter permease subunit [Bradyrhizobium yuanmingense]MDF0520205.1 ABC transporter permease subunit [Bradyrhizobium yuanmingense]
MTDNAMEGLAPRAAGRPAAMNDIGAMVVVVIAILVTMHVVSSYVPDYIMPSPVAVAKAGWKIVTQDMLHVAATVGRLLLALLFSLIAGVLIGLVMGISAGLRPFLRALIVIDTGIPALSWILLAVFWFKDPEIRIFFILTMILLPFYALNTYDGIRALPKDLVDMIESFRPSRWQVVRYLIAPHIVSYILLTTKTVVGYATRMVIFAELVAAAIGVGSRMGLAQSSFHMDEVLAWTFLLVLLNMVLQLIVNGIEKVALKWRPEASVR